MSVKIGDVVEYVDPKGVAHSALVTTVFDNGNPEKFPNPSVNLVWVQDDESMTDQYGRQIQRTTSVPNEKLQTAHGMFWR